MMEAEVRGGDATMLALQVVGGTTSQGMWKLLTARKSREVGSPPKPPEGVQLGRHLDFRIVDPQDGKRMCVAFSY